MATPKRVSDFESYRLNLKCVGFSGTASANSTTDIDFLINEERLITGARVMLQGHLIGDRLTFQVVDKDNVLGYGAGTILAEFAKDWYVCSDQQDQGLVSASYPASINAGLYIRIKYTNTNLLTSVQVYSNLFLHEVKS